MRIWSRREHWMVQAIIVLVGLGFIFLDPVWKGLGFQSFPTPFVKILEGLGTSLFLAGTASFGLEELIRGRTLTAYAEKTQELLGTTGEKLTSQITQFMESYVDALGKRVEQLGKEIHGSNIKMIYSIRANGIEAMAKAIKDADSFVYVMGISLREFFILDRSCYRALTEVYNTRQDLKFKILILNNRSLEALDRSNREEGATFTDVTDPEYKSATLFGETRRTITNIMNHFPKIALRVYDSQSLFLLITDKVVFMEPYHYGARIIKEAGPYEPPSLKRIAELVPLIEFEKSINRGPYEQFLGHFDYVFDKAREPDADNTRV